MQGEFTKEEAEECEISLIELGKALSKPKLREYFGHISDIALFLEAAKRAAPNEKK